MKVIIFGASGMVGQSVLRECIMDTGVEQVNAIGRTPLKMVNPKLKNIVHKDFLNFASLEKQFKGIDVCFYCLGIASAGLTEEEYKRITCDYTVAAAKTLLKVNPKISFIFISGMGADSTENGRIMWARVKGKTENEILAMKFKRAVVIRPAFIEPKDGIRSRTRLYRVLYRAFWPIMPLIKLFAPKSVIDTRTLGKLMLRIAREAAPKQIMESADMVAFAKTVRN